MSITSALFSEGQSRVFRWVFGQPEREFHLNELLRLTGLSSASVQRELNRLADAGLVLSERVGNLRRFRANPQSPVFEELVELTRKTLGAEPLLRDALQPLAPDLQAAWIYGSYAKQTDTANSDIDVMIVGDELSLNRVLKALAPVEMELGRKINPTLYTPAEFAKRRAEKDSFVNRVLEQTVLPLIGTLHESAGAG
ncbi:MAG: nucleotidyltransferase domain-containing protein [Burkholderiales bacterium]|jgi:predicted nucleotidyltransferase|nr:nucleotidyltransferase domain-containing protein [Burkholderiales bacterium]